VVLDRANAHDSPLLAPTLDLLDELGSLPERMRVHLDRGYDSAKTRDELAERGLEGEIAKLGSRRRSRPDSGGRSSARMPGVMRCTVCNAAMSVARKWSMRAFLSRMRSLRCLD
jgi:IS5 family transposase